MAEAKTQTDRVNLVYKTTVGGAEHEIELPFKLMVLSDLTQDARSEYFDEQVPILLRDSNLDVLFKQLRPTVNLRVKNRLSDEGDELQLSYALQSMDDFLPVNIIANTEVLSKVITFIDVLGDSQQSGNTDSIERSFTEEDREKIERVLKSEGASISEIVSDAESFGWLISNLERRVTEQLDEILHDAAFSTLEASWRSLMFLVERTDFAENIEIAVLNVSKQALIDDFEDVPEVIQSNYYKIIYSDEFGQFGGRPYGAIIANYMFTPNAQDVRLLQRVASVSSMAHAPFIAAASCEFFDIDSYSKFSKLRDVKAIFEQPMFIKWKSFRESPDAKYVALTLPSFLLRDLYEVAVGSLEYREKAKSVDNGMLWGNAAFAFATRLVASFASYRWCLNITGGTDGLVEGLNTGGNNADSIRTGKIPTQFLLTDKRETEVVAQGFIPLSVHKGDDTAAFYSAYSTQSFNEIAEKNSGDLAGRLAAQIPYLLIVSRISQYLKMMQREHIGSWKNRKDIDLELNNWLKQYVSDMDNPAPGVRARRPLRKAEVKVREVEGKADWFVTRITITPHIKYMGNSFTLAETSKLEKS